MQPVESSFGALSVGALKNALRAAAMLDVLIEADSPYRYFTYKYGWADQTDLAEVDDGCGNNMFAIFVAAENGLIKGFDHESALSPYPEDKDEVWPGIFDEVPDVFRPALSKLNPGETLPLDTTFCIWRTANDGKWIRGLSSFPDQTDDGGFSDLTSLIPLDSGSYLSWASGYYERQIPEDGVAAIYARKALTNDVLKTFEAEARRDSIQADAAIIAWPTALESD